MGCVVVVDAAAPLSLLKLQPLLVPSSFSSRFPLNPPPFFTGKGKGKGKGGTCLSCSHGLSLGLQGQQIRSLQRRYNRFVARNGSLMTNPTAPKNGVYTVGDFMTGKEDLHVVYPKTTVDEALEKLVEHRITGFPVVDQDWKLVGVVSDYDLLALDSISGRGERAETSLFPEVDRTWKTFNEIQRLLCKTNGKFVSDVMTPAPLVVRETTNLEDAARLLLETKYRRLPVVDSAGKLIGLITRGNVVRAALQIKRGNKHN